MHSIPLAEDDVAPTLADPALDLSSDLRGSVVAGGRHELAELFFHGSQGSVYLGRDTHSNRPVEVKILASEAATTAAVDRFRERSRRMLGLSHPGIAPVLGEGITENGLPFVVMEHREGRNLHHLQGDPRLTWPAPEAVLRQLGEALAALHALGVVHGAITAGNVVWIEDGAAVPRVQLVDREFHLPDSDEFTSFERRSTDDPNPADDLHALGKVVYELCTGRPPEGVPSMRDGQVSVPERFESVVLALVDPDPTARPTTALALLDLLDRATTGLPPGDLDFLAALNEPESTRFGTDPSTPPGTPPGTALGIPAPPRFGITEPPEPGPAAAMDTSSPAQALAAAMDAFGADDPPDRQRVPIPAAIIYPDAAPFAVVRPATDHSVPADRSSQRAPEAAPDTVADAIPVAIPDAIPDAIPVAIPDTIPVVTPVAPGLAAAPDDPPARPDTHGAATSANELDRDLSSTSDRTRLLLVVIGVGLILILIAWLLRGGGEPTPEAPAPAPVAAAHDAPAPVEHRVPAPTDHADATLASGAVQALPSAPDPEPEPEPAPAPDEPPPEQLSAGEFRRLMLRSNRSEAARSCYRKHARPGEEDIAVIAKVTPAGRIQKPRVSPEIPLADCLRKMIVTLEFPTAARPAQHNFIYRNPDAL